MNYPKKTARANFKYDKAERWKSLCNAYANAQSPPEFKIEADLLGATFFEKLKFYAYYAIKNESRLLLAVYVNIVVALLCVGIWFIPIANPAGLALKIFVSFFTLIIVNAVVFDDILDSFCSKMDWWISQANDRATKSVPQATVNSLSASICISI